MFVGPEVLVGMWMKLLKEAEERGNDLDLIWPGLERNTGVELLCFTDSLDEADA